ncbi:unnamed protein product [Somion occarium]|uniref:ribonuclease Z n=1 Tax=Somion occarium TaxID=3059160 RepID=A0ABP1DN12_9APHY
MIWSTDVISTVSSDTEPTFLITFNTNKYAFNAGECTGRSWRQGGRPWRGVNALFLTSIGTQRATGVPGLLMFLADASIGNLHVAGPRGLSHYLATLPLVHEPTPIFKDENITVFGIHLPPQSPADPVSALESNTSNMPEEPSTSRSKRKRSPSPKSSSKRQQVDETASDSANTSNSFMSTSLQGSFNKSNFSPYALIGDDAKEWLRLTIENMFPKMPPTPDEKKGRKGKKAKKVEESETVQPGFGGARHNKLVWHKERQLPKFVPSISNSSDPAMRETLCYVVVGPRYRGRFDPEKAEALGLEKQNRAKVCKGETVTFKVPDEKGNMIERTVRPEDVIGASEPPQVILILDVPSPAHIPDLTTAFETNPLYSRLHSKKIEDKNEYSVHVIYHMCGPRVLEDPRYKSFMNGFADSVHHVVASREHAPDPLTFTSVGGIQLKLNKLDSDMFPIPYYRLKPEKELSLSGLPPSVTLMQANLHTDCRPVKPPQLLDVTDNFHPYATGEKSIPLSKPVLGAFRRSRSRSRSPSPSRAANEPGQDVVVVPLGTSSAAPSKYRNVSSTLIQIPNYGNILLDAGEGTWGQLIRFYGDDPDHKSGVWEFLRNLKCIFVSHAHGDHHIGLIKLLAMRKQLRVPPTSPLWVVSLHPILLYLQEFSDLEDLGLNSPDGNGVIPVLSDALSWRPARKYLGGVASENQPWLDQNKSRALARDMCESLGLSDFVTVDVDHKVRCYGSVIKHKDNWSIVFSADTKPTNNLVRAGEGATLLIHEATMGDDQADAAKEKAHSTFGQAIEIGRKMEAKNILLTHFSARYPRLPPASMQDNTTWAVALDHAKIRIADIPKLRAYIPAIKRCFQEIEDDEDEVETQNTATWGD